MKAITILIAAALCVPALTACGGDDDDDDGGGGSGAGCEDACATAATLDCPNDEPSTCVQDCEDELAGFKQMYPDCGAQLDAAASCFAALPASSWACDADGEANPDMNQCSEQQNAVGACILGG